MQSGGGKIDAQLPQGKQHEQHDKIDEQVYADQQAGQNKYDQYGRGGDGLRHIAPGSLIDGVDGLFGFLLALFLMLHHGSLSVFADVDRRL